MNWLLIKDENKQWNFTLSQFFICLVLSSLKVFFFYFRKMCFSTGLWENMRLNEGRKKGSYDFITFDQLNVLNNIDTEKYFCYFRKNFHTFVAYVCFLNFICVFYIFKFCCLFTSCWWNVGRIFSILIKFSTETCLLFWLIVLY